jgi:sugar phosphate isomerase/epimerase
VDYQQALLDFAGGQGYGTPGFPAPVLAPPLARRLLARIGKMQWYLNRYSLELNFDRGKLTVAEFMDMARDWGFDGAQLHIAKNGPRVCLSGESDEDLKRLAEQKGKRKLDLQLDISTTQKSEVEDVIRVARAMGTNVIRCYTRMEGTLKEICNQTVRDLYYIAEMAEKWNQEFLLEQHELLTGSEMVDVVERVGSDRIGILFDFGNPVSAHREPLDDLMVMGKHIRGAHCKDVRIVGTDGIQAQLGVEMGTGHLNLAKLFLDLLSLGSESDAAQVKFFAIQMAVDHLCLGLRTPNESKTKIFARRNPSKTSFPANLTGNVLERRLEKERADARAALSHAKGIVEDLRKILAGYLDSLESR